VRLPAADSVFSPDNVSTLRDN